MLLFHLQLTASKRFSLGSLGVYFLGAVPEIIVALLLLMRVANSVTLPSLVFSNFSAQLRTTSQLLSLSIDETEPAAALGDLLSCAALASLLSPSSSGSSLHNCGSCGGVNLVVFRIAA